MTQEEKILFEKKVWNYHTTGNTTEYEIAKHFFELGLKVHKGEECNIRSIGSKHAQGKLGEMIKNLKPINKVLEQKPTEWSEEDKCMLNNVIDTLKPLSQTTHSGYAINSMIDWLKSLKDRVQSKQEWSEEDEQYLLVCKNALKKYEVSDKWDSNVIIRWLENRLKGKNSFLHLIEYERK